MRTHCTLIKRQWNIREKCRLCLSLLLLLFPVNDKTQSVAQVWISALTICVGRGVLTPHSSGHQGPGMQAIGPRGCLSPWGATA